MINRKVQKTKTMASIGMNAMIAFLEHLETSPQGKVDLMKSGTRDEIEQSLRRAGVYEFDLDVIIKKAVKKGFIKRDVSKYSSPGRQIPNNPLNKEDLILLENGTMYLNKIRSRRREEKKSQERQEAVDQDKSNKRLKIFGLILAFAGVLTPILIAIFKD